MAEFRETRADALGPRMASAMRGALTYPRMAYQHKSLLANFFQREFFGRFKGSVLGVGWVLIQPIFMFIVYFLVFGLLFGGIRGGADQPPGWFAFYLFAGLITWMLFSTTVPGALNAIPANSGLINKVAFPSEILVLPMVLVSILVLGVGLLVIALGSVLWWLLAESAAPVSWPGLKILYIFPLIFEAGLFTLGFGLLMATIYVFIRDVSEILPVVLQFWFFATPIFWPETMLENLKGELAWVGDFFRVFLWYNPFYHYVTGMRAAIGVFDHPGMVAKMGVESAGDLALRSCTWGLLPAVICFLVGAFFFNLHKKRFADEV